MHELCKSNASGNYFRAINDLWQPLNELIPLILGRRERLQEAAKKVNVCEKSMKTAAPRLPFNSSSIGANPAPKHKEQGEQGTSPGRSRLSLAAFF